MARFVLLLPLVGAAAADTACPDGVCPADADEHSALLQHRATQALNVSVNAGRACGSAWPLPASDPHCGASPAGTCGNPSLMCFRDTSGCPGGAGVGCMAAGSACPGMAQCRFCGTGGGAPDCPPAAACCFGMTLNCYACQAGMSEEELCKNYPGTTGCAASTTTTTTTLPPLTPCCGAMTAECLACQEGVTVDEFCTAGPGNAQVAGCDSTGPFCPQQGAVGKYDICEYRYSPNAANPWTWYGCCEENLWCTESPSVIGESRCLDYPRPVPMLAQAKLNCEESGTPGNVLCPGSNSSYCIGDQCCPRTAASGDKTFPCPSASNSFAGCESNTKLANCSSALAQVKVTLNCKENGTPGNVLCPGSNSSYCMGDQCCPRTAASGDKTFPCPSASNSFAGCESNTKLANCSSALAQVKKHTQ